MLLNPNSRFSMSGGRSGTITFVEAGRPAQIEWEMLVGPVDLGVHAAWCRWVDSGEAMSKGAIEAIVQEFATDSGLRVVLTFDDDEKVITPGT